MSNKTRKRIWPAALVMSLGIVGVLAAFLVLGANPAVTDAHDGPSGPTHCNDDYPSKDTGNIAHDFTGADHDCDTGPASTPTPTPTPGNGNGDMPEPPMIASSSTSGSATVELKLTIKLTEDVPVGGAFVLYLEDDFQEPDSISASDVYFVVSDPVDVRTGYGSRVYATQDPEIDTDDHFTADKDDIDIRVSVPDMCTNATDACEGSNGLMAGNTVTMVIQKSAGIKNPSEAGTHSVGASVLGPTDGVGGPMYTDDMINGAPLKTLAKISLSDVDNSRGYEMTVTGSGFNNGTTAGAYVLANALSDHMMWWEGLNCAQMLEAVGSDEDPMGNGPDKMKYCKHYLNTPPTNVTDPEKELSDEAKKSLRDMFLCARIIEDGAKAGGALVGTDDKVAVTFEVTVPTFKPGNVNYICMVDGEGRASSTDVEDFNLEPSIAVVPGTARTGDTVNVFAQDFQNVGQGFGVLKLGGQTMAPNKTPLSNFITDREPISISGSGSVTFEVPGGLEGTLRVDASWGDTDKDGKCESGEPCVSEDGKITLGGSELNASQTDVLPNETITINGNGFGSQTCIPGENITLDNVAVMVHEDSLSECTDRNGDKPVTFPRAVVVSNSGQFVATVILWPAERDAPTNPSLIPGVHTLDAVDSQKYDASISLTISEPSITVTPNVAGPRDYITVTGENWAVDNLDNSLSDPIDVVVEDYDGGRRYPVYADSVGRFTVEHRVHRRVAIPDTVQVKANYDDGRVVQIGSFSVPASTIEITPGEGQPGDMVTLTASNMPVYTEADYVEIGGTTYSDPGVNTDRDGNITVEDVLIPGLDPGVYSVVINVDDTIAIGEVSVLAESAAAGAPAELPGSVDALGDNVVAIFHFDDVGKGWAFYDPRPEFSDLNTLTEMVNGEAYWILVSETVEDVVLNNKVRSLTCRGDDCWNLEVW